MSLLLESEVLKMFFNTLTANDKYSRHYRGNFRQPNQMQISKKSQGYSSNSLSILKKNDAPHNLSISDILDSKKSSYLNV